MMTYSNNNNDKLQHFWVSWAMVIVLYTIISKSYCCREILGMRHRLILASVVTFLGGLIKEAGDEFWWSWSWCPPCQADGWDLLANTVGIVMANLGIILFVMVQSQVWMTKKKTNTTTTTNTYDDDDYEYGDRREKPREEADEDQDQDEATSSKKDSDVDEEEGRQPVVLHIDERDAKKENDDGA